MPRRAPRTAALAALAAVPLTGCGSRDVADYPPPPALPEGPAPIADLPGRVLPPERPSARAAPPGDEPGAGALRLDRARSTLTVGGRTVRTPLEPTGAARLPGGPILVVGGRERALAAFDPRTLRELGRVPAGVGPTAVAAKDGLAFVADTTGRALLVFRTTPELALVHRTTTPRGPWALAVDAGRDRIWVTIPRGNRLIAYSAETRPRRTQGFGTVRQPRSVRVASDGTLVVRGRDATQVIDPETD
jgi:hypothetical protein